METPVDARTAAERLGISRSQVYTLARSGRLPAYRIAGSWRFLPSDLAVFLKSCRVAMSPVPTPEPATRPKPRRIGRVPESPHIIQSPRRLAFLRKCGLVG